MSIRLVVGLGNPGEGYACTRHNVGFLVVEEIARRCGARWHHTPSSDWAVCRDGLALVKPMTYMNRSGAAVAPLLEREGIAPAELLVVVDDVDLPLGRLRMKRSGGPGTHNGLRDLCERLGRDFGRLRVGVRGDEAWQDLAEYVLSPFAEGEVDALRDAVDRAADAVRMLRERDWSDAMSEVNRRPESDDPE